MLLWLVMTSVEVSGIVLFIELSNGLFIIICWWHVNCWQEYGWDQKDKNSIWFENNIEINNSINLFYNGTFTDWVQ